MKSKKYFIIRPIILVVTILSILLVLFGIMNLKNLNKFESNTSYIKESSFEQLSLLNSIGYNMGIRKLNTLYYLFSQNQEDKEEYKENIINFNKENNQHLNQLSILIKDEKVRQQLSKVLNSRTEYNLKVNEAIELFSSGSNLDPIEYEERELRPFFTEYANELKALSIFIITNSSDTISTVLESVENSKRIIYLLVLVGILLLFFSGWTIIKVVRKLKADYALLIQSQSELKALYNEMEETVKERTKELVKANTELTNLYKIVDISDNPILITDPDDNIVFWNKGAETTYGYSKEEAMNSNRPDLLKMKFGKPYTEIKKEILTKGEWKGEVTAITKDGKLINAITQITLLKDNEGKPVSILEVSQDITKRKEIEKEVVKYNKDLREINEATEKIISVISHDLKNPIAGIVSSSEVLKNNIETFEKEHIKEFSNIIHRASTKLLDRLNELIIWVNTKHTKAAYDPHKVKLHSVINKALDALLLNAKQKDIKIENKIPEDIFVFADINMLKSVVQNLVSNSIKFTPKDGHILITANIKNSMAEVHIKDNGVGMPQEILNSLLKNKNVSTKGTEKELGTGLGLKLVKDFVIQNGGDIYFESEENKGTTVTFTLKLADN